MWWFPMDECLPPKVVPRCYPLPPHPFGSPIVMNSRVLILRGDSHSRNHGVS